MKSIIVAVDQLNGIGAENDLLWSRDLPDDLKHFREATTGNSIIMGRKTFESIGSRPLPNRQNIVVSSNLSESNGVEVAGSLEVAYNMAMYPIFVIGGGRVYRAALEDVDKLYVTEVKATFLEATTFFPPIDLSLWCEVSRKHHDIDARNKYSFDWVEYERRLASSEA